MNTHYVLFCLETNRYLNIEDNRYSFVVEYLKAKHFKTKEETVEFLSKEIVNIRKETGVHHFTTREYFSI